MDGQVATAKPVEACERVRIWLERVNGAVATDHPEQRTGEDSDAGSYVDCDVSEFDEPFGEPQQEVVPPLPPPRQVALCRGAQITDEFDCGSNRIHPVSWPARLRRGGSLAGFAPLSGDQPR
jgi:hypothetical protein